MLFNVNYFLIYLKKIFKHRTYFRIIYSVLKMIYNLFEV